MNTLATPVKKRPKLSISIDTMPPNDPCLPLPHSTFSQAEKSPSDVDYPLADLWGDWDCTFVFTNYFEEMKSQMKEGESLIMCLLHPDDELGLKTDCDTTDPSDDENGLFNVLASEIEGLFFGTNHHSRMWTRLRDIVVSSDSPYYPWCSKAEFITHLLFSSPRVHFSDQQKKAILEWVTALSAPNVPSLFAVVSSSGNMFYLNSISKAIALDFANPLTRLTMQDYSKDRQGQMSQVQHGSKMLMDLLDDLAPPSVQVNGKVFFVYKLLQQSVKGYFIPMKLFQA
ncbi:hypothetical protein HD554DRAFT_2174244 [Boletus coccyginus]|nr:hypothetical protein HD554DRAFT_2174244 [Boletus coccyginus]